MHAKRSSSNNLHHRENADRDHQVETQKRSWQPKLTAQPLRSNCVHNLGATRRRAAGPQSIAPSKMSQKPQKLRRLRRHDQSEIARSDGSKFHGCEIEFTCEAPFFFPNSRTYFNTSWICWCVKMLLNGGIWPLPSTRK